MALLGGKITELECYPYPMSRTFRFLAQLESKTAQGSHRGNVARDRSRRVHAYISRKAISHRCQPECLIVHELQLQSEPRAMAETIINDTVLQAAELLRSLEKAGAVGSPKEQLVGGRGRKGKEEALATLIARREVLNVGAHKKPRYALAKLCDPLDLARIAIEEKAVPGCATLFSKQELAEGCSPAAEEEFDAALAELVREGRIICAERGKAVYYLHKAAIDPLTSADSRWHAATSRVTSTLAVDRIQHAYREIVWDTGFSDVTISELQRRAGVPLDALKRWLLEESRAGRVLPTRGDWSLGDTDSRAAAIDIAGEPHLRIRFIS